MNRILIFGATSAIAQACARLWVARGASLFLVGRDAAKLEALRADLAVRAGPSARIETRRADLDEIAAHEGLYDAAEQALGGLDAVLVAHGSLPDQARCQAEPALALAQIHTNGLSAVSLAGLAASRFEARRSGCIAVITSVAGLRGRQSNYVYGAAKGLVILYLQGLRNRLSRSGVAVVDIRPGFVDTPMTAAFEKKGPLWAQPQDVARGIVAAMDRGTDIAYLPWFWRLIMSLIVHVPERVFKRMKL